MYNELSQVYCINQKEESISIEWVKQVNITREWQSQRLDTNTIITQTNQQATNGKKQIKAGHKVINLFSCSTQLSTKFQLLIKTKILTNNEVSCFKSLRCFYHAHKC